MRPNVALLARAAAVLAVLAAAVGVTAGPTAAGAPFTPRPQLDEANADEITVGRDGAVWTVASASPLTLRRVDAAGGATTVVTAASGAPADLAPGLGTDPVWVALGDRIVRVAADGTTSTVSMPSGASVVALEPSSAGDRMWFLASDTVPADGATVGSVDSSGALTSRPTSVPIHGDAELVAGPGGTPWALTAREIGELVRLDADLSVTPVDVGGTVTGTPALGPDGLLYVPVIAGGTFLVRVRADGTRASTVPLPVEGGDAVAGPDGAVHLSVPRGYLRVGADGQVRPLLRNVVGDAVVLGRPGESVAFGGDLLSVGIGGQDAGVFDLDERAVPLVDAASEGAPGADGRVSIAVTVSGAGAPPSGTVSVVELRCCDGEAAQAITIGSAALDAAGRARIMVTATDGAVGFWVDYPGDRSHAGTTSIQVPYLDPGGEVGRYVNQVYADLLGRTPEQAGFDYWSVQLLGGAPRTAVAHALVISTEHRQRLVERLFRDHLDREADPAGRDAFVADLARGATIDQVRASILGSREFFLRAGGGTVAGFVDALYGEVLGRPADAAGRAYWSAQIAAGVSLPTVASALLASEEAAERLVDRHFQDLLRRPVDPGGRAYWAGLLQRGFREERLVAELIGSDEYYRAAVAGRF